MTKARLKEEIAKCLKDLATTYVLAIRQLEETLAILCRELDLQETSWLADILALEPGTDPVASAVRPIADRATLSVVFQGRSCFLGNTLLFHFFETISRRPNRYYSHSELLDEVWGGPRSDATIRNVAKRLRDQLTSASLSELAESIDGSTPGFYVLRLSRVG